MGTEPQFCHSERLSPSCCVLQPCRPRALRPQQTACAWQLHGKEPSSPRSAARRRPGLSAVRCLERMKKQEETGTGRAARRWGFWYLPATQASSLGTFQDPLPLPNSHQRKHTVTVTQCHVSRPGRLHWDSAHAPASDIQPVVSILYKAVC